MALRTTLAAPNIYCVPVATHDRVGSVALGERRPEVLWPVPDGRRFYSAPRKPPPLMVCRATGRSRTEVADTRPVKEVCRNRKATFDFELLERYECGLELQGSEVKSIRAGEVSLQDAFCKVIDGELILINAYVSSGKLANSFDNHEPTRMRRLLVHKKQVRKIRQKTEEKGLTVVPTRMYFSGSWVKVEVALARGKNTVDKRQDIKKKEINRDLARISKLQY